MLKRLSHICLGTPNLEKMISFYVDTLQCQIVHQFINEAGERYGAFLLVGDGTFIEMFNDQKEHSGYSLFRHICFQVEERSPLERAMSNHNIKLDWVRGKTDKVLQTWVKDPDGNKVEFHLYDEQAVQYPYLPESRGHSE